MPTTFFRRVQTPLAAASLLLLAACSGGIEPPGYVGNSPVFPETPPDPSIPASQATFAFEPFTGAPGNLADDLSKYIGEEARKQGLTLVRRIGAPATYRVNGYLAANGGPSEVTVTYVFDIVSANGTRLKRIADSESASGTYGDPWEGVDADDLQRIAERTVLTIKAWLNR